MFQLILCWSRHFGICYWFKPGLIFYGKDNTNKAYLSPEVISSINNMASYWRYVCSGDFFPMWFWFHSKAPHCQFNIHLRTWKEATLVRFYVQLLSTISPVWVLYAWKYRAIFCLNDTCSLYYRNGHVLVKALLPQGVM